MAKEDIAISFLLLLVLLLLVQSIKPEVKKDNPPSKPFSGAGGTLHAKHPIQPAPTPPRASSSWSFGVELLQAELQSWSHAKQALSICWFYLTHRSLITSLKLSLPHTRLEVEDEQEEGKKHTGGWCCLTLSCSCSLHIYTSTKSREKYKLWLHSHYYYCYYCYHYSTTCYCCYTATSSHYSTYCLLTPDNDKAWPKES
jgi:hypothetical protein